MFETHVTVVGTLITAVGRRRLPDGTTVVNFRVASNERRYDRVADTWTDGDSLYVSVTCWRQLAENVHASFVIGDPIMVRGRLRTRDYDDKDGRRHSITELEGLAVGPDLTRSTAKITRLRRDGTPVAATPNGSGGTGGAGVASDDPWSSDVAAAGDSPAYDATDATDPRAAVEAGVGS